jgi:trimeric autotransporter adhesin
MKRITTLRSMVSFLILMTLPAPTPIQAADDRKESDPRPAPPGVVKSVNGFSGSVTLRAGTNIILTPGQNGLTISGVPTVSNNSNTWTLGGNVASPDSFLGTLNDQPLELKVNGQRALRLEPGSRGAPNVIGGTSVNHVGPRVRGAVIGGGGATDYILDLLPQAFTNFVGADFGVVGGGMQNSIGPFARWAVVAGGSYNSVAGDAEGAAVGGGGGNSVAGSHCAIGGGCDNAVEAGAICSTIAGGLSNQAGMGASFAFIGGGLGNTITGSTSYASVVGGERNSVECRADYAAIGGGWNNRIGQAAEAATIAGGRRNQIEHGAIWSTVGGGFSNEVLGQGSTVAGGVDGYINSSYAFVGGGVRNIVEHGADGGSIVGGSGNTVLGSFGAVLGGVGNDAGTASLAAGTRAKARHAGSFVWGDGTEADVNSIAPNSFTVRAAGGVTFYSSSSLASGVHVPPGAGSWSTLSDRAMKENIKPVNGRAILEKLSTLSLSGWNYCTEDKSIRHLGPMAQDFHAAFGLGSDDKHIATVDADGVALAAIQGLNEIVREKQVEIESLKSRLDKLEKLMEAAAGGAR